MFLEASGVAFRFRWLVPVRKMFHLRVFLLISFFERLKSLAE